jgi:FkbM family methyltransferase
LDFFEFVVDMGSSNIVFSLAAKMARLLPDSYKRAIYQNKSFSRIVRSGLNLVAPAGLSEVAIAAGELQGMHMLLDLQTEKDYWLGTYEPDLQAAIADLVSPGQVIYDIGASVGFLTLLFASRSGVNGHVYAFEALPANVNRLKQNLELNAYQERVTVVHAAVQDRSGRTEFHPGPSAAMGKVDGSAGRSTIEYQPGIQIEGVAVDDFVYNSENSAPDMLKMDIEGGEILALPGMSRLLRENHPILMVELHGPDAARITWQLLKEEGYKICKMMPGYPQVRSLEELDWKSYLVAFAND